MDSTLTAQAAHVISSTGNVSFVIPVPFLLMAVVACLSDIADDIISYFMQSYVGEQGEMLYYSG
jgi:hypothetical protein